MYSVKKYTQTSRASMVLAHRIGYAGQHEHRKCLHTCVLTKHQPHTGLQASLSVHRMSFVPLRLATRGLLGQNIRIKRYPAMMQNVVSAATSAAPQVTPTPEPMKVQPF